MLLRKEVIHPLLPERIPCYDFTLIIDLTLVAPCGAASGAADFPHVTGCVYKKRERIHRGLLTRDYYQVRLHALEFQRTI